MPSQPRREAGLPGTGAIGNADAVDRSQGLGESFVVVADQRSLLRAIVGEVLKAAVEQVFGRHTGEGLEVGHDAWERGAGHVNGRDVDAGKARAVNMPRHRTTGHARDDALPLPSVGNVDLRLKSARFDPQCPGAMLVGVLDDAADQALSPTGRGVDQNRDFRWARPFHAVGLGRSDACVGADGRSV